MAKLNVPNSQLRALLAEAGWTGEQLAQAVNRAGRSSGLALSYQRASVSQWLAGTTPRPPVSDLVAEVLTLRLGRRVTPLDAGFAKKPAPASTAEQENSVHWRSVLLTSLDKPSTAAGATRIYRAASLPGTEEIPMAWPDGAAVEGLAPSAAELRWAGSMVTLFSVADRTFGGGHARPALQGFLAHTVAPWLSAPASPGVRRELLTTAARLTYLCGFMNFDDERQGTAQSLYRLSLSLCEGADDQTGAALALRALSVQSRALGYFANARVLAEAAVARGARQAPRHVRASLIGQLGVAEAASGNKKEALRLLGRAESNLGRTSDAPHDVGAFDTAAFAHQEAVVMHYLGQKKDALLALERSVRLRRPGEARSQAILLARLAERQLAQGHVEAACQTWHGFLDLIPGLTSRRIDRARNELAARLRPYRTLPAVAALLRRNSALIPDRDGATSGMR
ncbi:hypothetical protein [Streptomyces sp. NPDC088910]|uniref:hypothetical protein n=1 Tax=Streptomyces sp. NPDC088910 TaxID=3365911 RepID=UPI003823792F